MGHRPDPGHRDRRRVHRLPAGPDGTTLTIELTLPTTDQTFALPAIVRWSAAGPDGGMGVQFVGIDVDVLLELNDYFATLSAEHPTVR